MAAVAVQDAHRETLVFPALEEGADGGVDDIAKHGVLRGSSGRPGGAPGQEEEVQAAPHRVDHKLTGRPRKR
jgi:hypothetical protein